MTSRSSSLRLFAEVLCLIALAEGLVMQLLPWLAPGVTGMQEGTLDVTLLVLLTAPFLYWRTTVSERRTHVYKNVADTKRITWRKAIGIAVLSQCLGMALTLTAVVWKSSEMQAAEDLRFATGTDRIENEIQRRFGLILYGLKGIGSAMSTSQKLTHADFQRLVETRDLAHEFAGVQGFGLVKRVQRTDLARFQAEVRADHAPDFVVHADASPADMFLVQTIEPLALNRGLRGWNLAQEAVPNEGVLRAAVSGLPTLTGRVSLTQQDKVSAGLLYLLPLYRGGVQPAKADQRWAELTGLVLAPIVVQDLLRGVVGVNEGALDFELFDGENCRAQDLLFDNDGHFSTLTAAQNGVSGETRAHSLERRMEVNGRTLTLRVTSNAAFGASGSRYTLALIGAGGLLASLLVTLAVWLLAVNSLRAQRLASKMTTDVDRLARVVQHTNNAVTLTDAQMRITWVNEAFTRITGYTLAEARGRTPGDLLGSGKSDPKAIQTLAESIAHGTPCRVQVLNRAKAGHEYWVDTEVQPTRDAQGFLVGFMEIGTDVTAQVAAQTEMRQMADRLAMAAEGGSDGLWDWMDIHEDAQWWSPSYYSMLGFTPEEMPPASSSYTLLLHPQSIGPSLKSGQDAFAGIAPFDLEVQMRTKHSGFRWFRTRAKVYRDAQGNPVRMSGATQDIHERKLAEAKAQEAASILRNSIEALDDAFVLFDQEDRLLLCNQRYREFYPETAVMLEPGNTFEDIIRYGAQHGQYQNAVGREEEWVAERLALHRQSHSRMQQTTRGGRTLRVVERRTADGFTVGFRVDVTDLVNATRVAEEASVAKSQFLANMSHEIRTPMNAILGMLKLLQNTELSMRQQDYVGKTEGAARSLLGLLNDILDFSKVEAGKMTLDPRPFRMDRLLRDLSVILSANVGEKDVEVLFDIDPEVPKSLVGDDLRLQQVLINLGGNAIKFTAQGEVVIALRMLERTSAQVLLEFSVRDSGIGIAPENQERIFSGFSQAEANTTRRFGGTGLGLAISSRLAALMGGKLQVNSVLNQGSTFSFEIRLDIAPGSDAVAVPAAMLNGRGTLRTLVVDDNAVARELLSQMAQSLGWDVDVAADGPQAVDCVQKSLREDKPYRAIFMDWQMPGMDGWRTCERIRELTMPHESAKEALAAPPLVMMVTAHGREMLAQRSAQDQALLNGFLVKPVTASMLFDAVQDALAAIATAASGHNPAAPRPVELRQRLRGMRLLVVEDNKINQMVAQGLLTQEGADVTLADDGQRGVEAVSNTQPAFDVVLMDLQMPVMDGFEATRAIRQQLGMAGLPIVAMTANAMASDRAACLAAGMNDHVGKPFELDHLVATLLHQAGREATPALPARPLPPIPAEPVAEAGSAGDLDVQGALARLGGDRDIYASVLQTFSTELQQIPLQVAQALSAGEWSDAARALHTLKGLSGTLGARQLATVAAQLEKACKDNSAQAEVEGMLAVLQQAISALEPNLLQALLQYAPDEPVPGQSPLTPLDRTAFLRDLQALERQLSESDMAALEVYRLVQETYGAHLAQEIKPLKDAMAALDFAKALGVCKDLLRNA